MKIILTQEVAGVGSAGDVAEVKDGYARNYLIPQGMAIIANNTNRSRLEDLKRREAAAATRMLDEYKALAEKLEGKILKIGAKAGTSGKIFGSVTNVQIANALQEQLEIEIDRRKVIIPEEVKVLGAYVAELNLHPDLDIKVNFEVIAE